MYVGQESHLPLGGSRQSYPCIIIKLPDLSHLGRHRQYAPGPEKIHFGNDDYVKEEVVLCHLPIRCIKTDNFLICIIITAAPKLAFLSLMLHPPPGRSAALRSSY